MRQIGKLWDWWQARAHRERTVLVSGVLLVLCVSIWLIMEPVIQQRHRMLAELPKLEQDLSWMQDNVEQVNRLRGGNNAATTGKTALSVALVEEIMRDTGVHEQVSELRPTSGQGVMVKFSKVAYSQLMEFLFRLKDRAEVRVSLASISRLQDQAGMVEASLSLSPDANQ
jgi:type II secretory pathway component PulM